jgi:hypothetical protein
MATVYNVKVVSDWINYTESHLQEILINAINMKEREKGNTISIEVLDRR